MSRLVFACIWWFVPTAGQICNDQDPNSGGLMIPPWGHGGSMATQCYGTREGPDDDTIGEWSNCSNTNTNTSKCGFLTDCCCEIKFCDLNKTTSAPVNGCYPPPFDVQGAMSVGYLFCLLYSFLGISIIADIFMASIDVIAGATKIVQTRDKVTGETKQAQVMIWNVTVANLTLMALGTSAPEILLSLMEILSAGFYEGALGPGAIVGSAAFNLMIISAVCMVAIPKPNLEQGETGFRKVDMLQVFLTTTFFSVFAYAWLLIILVVITPDVVTVTEAAITFALYPFMVLVSWLVDIREAAGKRREFETAFNATQSKEYSKTDIQALLAQDHVRNLTVEEASALAQYRQFENSRKSQLYFRREGVAWMTGSKSKIPKKPVLEENTASNHRNILGFDADSYIFFEDAGDATAVVRRVGDLSQELTVDYTFHAKEGDHAASLGDDFEVQQIALNADGQIRKRNVSSSSLVSSESTPLLMHDNEEKKHGGQSVEMVPVNASHQTSWLTNRNTQDKSSKTMDDIFIMMGMNLMVVMMTMPRNTPVTSRFFITLMGMMMVAGGYKKYGGNILPRLRRRARTDGSADKPSSGRMIQGRLVFKPLENQKIITIPIYDDSKYEHDEIFEIQLGPPQPAGITQLGIARTRIRVVDDDVGFSPGKIEMAMTSAGAAKYVVSENIGHVLVKLVRVDGARGDISVQYETVSGTATADRDFVYKKGTITFAHGQTSRFIEIDILDDQRFEKSEMFKVILSNPQGCSLGSVLCAEITITDDDYMNDLSDKIAAQLNLNRDKWNVVASSWSAQFSEACAIPEGCGSQFMHVLSLPMKFVFAFVPPAPICGGWPCYLVSFCIIGLLTCVIADLATLFGCAVGMKDEVTAITVVAMGTSLPDLFSAKIVAVQDKTADNSVGKVTGSNSVNIFLGLGLPWLIAAVYWEVNGPTDEWRARYPDMVSLYPDGAFVVRAGTLAFTIAVFFGCCVIGLGIIFFRRAKYGAELGGGGSVTSAIAMLALWFVYLTISILQIYGYIEV